MAEVAQTQMHVDEHGIVTTVTCADEWWNSVNQVSISFAETRLGKTMISGRWDPATPYVSHWQVDLFEQPDPEWPDQIIAFLHEWTSEFMATYFPDATEDAECVVKFVAHWEPETIEAKLD